MLSFCTAKRGESEQTVRKMSIMIAIAPARNIPQIGGERHPAQKEEGSGMSDLQTRLEVFSEFLDCAGVALWHYDGEMRLLRSNHPCKEDLQQLFGAAESKTRILDYCRQNRLPCLGPDSAALLWMAAPYKVNGVLTDIYVIGPVFPSAIDEAWDMWYNHKTRYDYADNWEANWQQDLTAMARRDYNHPSVIAYSIGNEVSEPAEAKGVALAHQMVELLHGLDKGRPVTAGINLMIIDRASRGQGIYANDGSGVQAQKKKKPKDGQQEEKVQNASLMFNIMASLIGSGMNKAANSKHADAVTAPVLDALDLAGYNYASGRYEKDGKLHPDRVIYGSETFPQDIAKNWAKVERLPYLVGDFMWTGWDYLGEVGLGAWSYEGGVPFGRPYPWLLSDSGVINILGRPDFSCRYAAAVWGKLDGPAIGVRPCNHPGKRPSRSVWRGTNAIESWSWQGCDGNAAVVEVCGEGASVVLHLNGKRVGRKRLKDKKALFRLRYTPGTLEAVLYDGDGKATGRTALRSAAGDLCLHLEAEGQAFHPGQVVYLPLTIRGKNGVVESNADEAVTLTVKGGELLGFGSANPCTTDRFDAGRCTTYQGCALAVVRLGEGPLTVTATGTSLPGATLTLTTI